MPSQPMLWKTTRRIVLIGAQVVSACVLRAVPVLNCVDVLHTLICVMVLCALAILLLAHFPNKSTLFVHCLQKHT